MNKRKTRLFLQANKGIIRLHQTGMIMRYSRQITEVERITSRSQVRMLKYTIQMERPSCSAKSTEISLVESVEFLESVKFIIIYLFLLHLSVQSEYYNIWLYIQPRWFCETSAKVPNYVIYLLFARSRGGQLPLGQLPWGQLHWEGI